MVKAFWICLLTLIASMIATSFIPNSDLYGAVPGEKKTIHVDLEVEAVNGLFDAQSLDVVMEHPAIGHRTLEAEVTNSTSWGTSITEKTFHGDATAKVEVDYPDLEPLYGTTATVTVKVDGVYPVDQGDTFEEIVFSQEIEHDVDFVSKAWATGEGKPFWYEPAMVLTGLAVIVGGILLVLIILRAMARAGSKES